MATGNTPQAAINDIKSSRDSIAQAIRNKGVTVDTTAKLADLPAKVAAIATANLQSNKTVTPSESKQTVKPDSGYNGLSQVTVNAVSSTYVGSGVAKKSSSDLTASGATVTAPAGYYASAASQSVTTATRAGTSITTTADSTNAKLTLSASNNQSTGYVTADTSKNTATKVITLTASGATVTATDNSSTPVEVSKSVATATRAGTSITTTADDTNDKLTLTASNNQTTGYVTADTSKNTATKVITLTASGATVTATDNSSTPVKISKSVTTADRASTTLTSEKSNNSLVFTATNSQSTGYVTADTSKDTATQIVSISRNGATVTATDGANSISSTVPDASITENDGVVTVGTAGYVSAGTTLYELADTEIVVIPDDADDVVQIRAYGGKASVGTEFSLTVDQPSINTDNGVVTATATLQENEDFVDGRDPASISQTSTLNLGISSIGSATGSTEEAANRTIGYGQQATISAGYFPTTRIVRNSVGSVSGSIGGTVKNGSCTAGIEALDGVKTITPASGQSAGTHFFRVKATTTGTAGSFTPKYTVTTPGYISDTVTGDAQTIAVAADDTGKTICIPKASFTVDGKSVKVTSTGGGYVKEGTIVGTVSDSYIIPSGTKTISSSGTHDVKAYANASVASGSATVSGSITANPSIATNATTITAGRAYKMSVSGSKSITPTVTKGYIESGTAGTVTVSGEAYVMESSTGSATTSSTTTTATRTIGYNQETTIGAGYYPSARIIRNSVSAGKATTPATTITKNPTISVNASGVISASVSGTQSVTPSVTAGYVSSGTAGTITVSGSATKKATDLDSNLVASKIKKGETIFGVTGSYEGGASVGTCTVILDVGTMYWYTNSKVRVFYTSYSSSGFNTNVIQKAKVTTSGDTITLSNVVCGSAISVYTEVYAYIDPSTYTKYTDEYNHCIMCPNSPGQTVTIELLENS